MSFLFLQVSLIMTVSAFFLSFEALIRPNAPESVQKTESEKPCTFCSEHAPSLPDLRLKIVLRRA